MKMKEKNSHENNMNFGMQRKETENAAKVPFIIRQNTGRVECK